MEQDGKDIWRLIKDTRVLDLNSAYSYLMLCKYFSDTCVIAETNGSVAGFVSGFIAPTDSTVLFVWQVAVDERVRRRGLGMNMLKHLLTRDSSSQTRYLEITANPSNHAAWSLYHHLAQKFNTKCEVSECFPSRLFPGGQHEDELMLRIGPFNKSV